jgi:hypothetical protein
LTPPALVDKRCRGETRHLPGPLRRETGPWTIRNIGPAPAALQSGLFHMIDLPSTDAVHLLNRFNVAALFVIVVPGRPSPVIVAGGAADIRRSLSWYVNSNLYGAMFRAERPDIPWAAWCERAAAGRIAEAVAHRSRGGLVQADVAGAVGMIRATAARYRVALAPHEATLARVTARVDAIATRIENTNSNGGLQAFNAMYRARRLAAQKTGARMMPYGLALSRLRRAIGEHTAAAHAGKIGPDVLRAVFGD